jgi:Flavodoxins
MKQLVVFYSRADENYFGGKLRYLSTGNTEKIAKMVAEIRGADLFQIEQKMPYATDYNTCIEEAKKDLKENIRPELVSTLESIDGYDEIYIGFPNYWGTMPMAVFTFLEQFDWSGKTIHPFVTHEGSGFGKSMDDLEKVCRGAVFTKGLAISGSSVDYARAKVEGWV